MSKLKLYEKLFKFNTKFLLMDQYSQKTQKKICEMYKMIPFACYSHMSKIGRNLLFKGVIYPIYVDEKTDLEFENCCINLSDTQNSIIIEFEKDKDETFYLEILDVEDVLKIFEYSKKNIFLKENFYHISTTKKKIIIKLLFIKELKIQFKKKKKVTFTKNYVENLNFEKLNKIYDKNCEFKKLVKRSSIYLVDKQKEDGVKNLFGNDICNFISKNYFGYSVFFNLIHDFYFSYYNSELTLENLLIILISIETKIKNMKNFIAPKWRQHFFSSKFENSLKMNIEGIKIMIQEKIYFKDFILFSTNLIETFFSVMRSYLPILDCYSYCLFHNKSNLEFIKKMDSQLCFKYTKKKTNFIEKEKDFQKKSLSFNNFNFNVNINFNILDNIVETIESNESKNNLFIKNGEKFNRFLFSTSDLDFTKIFCFQYKNSLKSIRNSYHKSDMKNPFKLVVNEDSSDSSIYQINFINENIQYSGLDFQNFSTKIIQIAIYFLKIEYSLKIEEEKVMVHVFVDFDVFKKVKGNNNYNNYSIILKDKNYYTLIIKNNNNNIFVYDNFNENIQDQQKIQINSILSELGFVGYIINFKCLNKIPLNDDGIFALNVVNTFLISSDVSTIVTRFTRTSLKNKIKSKSFFVEQEC
jgi:hypothetical protein